jgi:hypothetical protein
LVSRKFFATCWVMVEAPTGRRIDARVAVEVLVFGRQEGVDHPFGNRLDRHENPLLGGVLSQQPAIARMNPGHRRWIVVGQLLVVGQVLAVVVEDVEHAAARRQGAANQQNQDCDKYLHVDPRRGLRAASAPQPVARVANETGRRPKPSLPRAAPDPIETCDISIDYGDLMARHEGPAGRCPAK